MLRRALAATLLLAASPALAEEREFCADRPGLGTPACTLAPGAAMVETGIAAWERTRDAATVADDLTFADVLLRLGVGETTEIQLGLTGRVVQRERDRLSGAVDRVSGIGDGTFALRQSLSGANGPLAVMAYVSLPIAKRPIGSGEWSGGVMLPLGFDLSDGLSLDFTPQVEFAANGARSGHHMAWGGVVGMTKSLGERLSLTGEFGAMQDDDPDGHSTDARLACSLAWQVARHLQLDFEADVGLSSGAPDHALALGFAWQFR